MPSHRGNGTPLPLDPATSADALAALEFQAVLDVVAGYAAGPLGAGQLRARRPTADAGWIRWELALVGELLAVLRRGDHARRLVAEACAGCSATPAEMPERIRDLLRTLGLPHTLAVAGVPRDALPDMAQAADAVRLSNNPRRLTTAHALGILERAF